MPRAPRALPVSSPALGRSPVASGLARAPHPRLERPAGLPDWKCRV